MVLEAARRLLSSWRLSSSMSGGPRHAHPLTKYPRRQSRQGCTCASASRSTPVVSGPPSTSPPGTAGPASPAPLTAALCRLPGARDAMAVPACLQACAKRTALRTRPLPPIARTPETGLRVQQPARREVSVPPAQEHGRPTPTCDTSRPGPTLPSLIACQPAVPASVLAPLLQATGQVPRPKAPHTGCVKGPGRRYLPLLLAFRPIPPQGALDASMVRTACRPRPPPPASSARTASRVQSSVVQLPARPAIAQKHLAAPPRHTSCAAHRRADRYPVSSAWLC